MVRKKSSSPSLFGKILQHLTNIFRRKPKPEPEDPYAYRMAPVKHPPHGRSGAAVAELDEE